MIIVRLIKVRKVRLSVLYGKSKSSLKVSACLVHIGVSGQKEAPAHRKFGAGAVQSHRRSDIRGVIWQSQKHSKPEYFGLSTISIDYFLQYSRAASSSSA